MKLKTVKTLSYVSMALVCGFTVLFALTQAVIFLLAEVVIAAVMIVLMLLFWRCPHCGKYLGDGGSYCRFCGEKIDLESRVSIRF